MATLWKHPIGCQIYYFALLGNRGVQKIHEPLQARSSFLSNWITKILKWYLGLRSRWGSVSLVQTKHQCLLTFLLLQLQSQGLSKQMPFIKDSWAASLLGVLYLLHYLGELESTSWKEMERSVSPEHLVPFFPFSGPSLRGSKRPQETQPRIPQPLQLPWF